MQTIWKYKIPPDHYGFSLELPKRAEILTVQMQNEEPVIWVLLETKEIKELRHFRYFWTGERINSGFSLRYIGTFTINQLVYHLFEDIAGKVVKVIPKEEEQGVAHNTSSPQS